MIPKEEKSDEENTSECTTLSSDSYSYLLRDVENPGNHINEEWEAIERTLYQEKGKHVTDPALLKECKLWRETFPHIRVRGIGIKVEQNENISIQSAKSVEGVDDDELALDRLHKKREKIKQAVVSQIVERIINKLNLNKENSVVTGKMLDIKEDINPNSNNSRSAKIENESYFERGKKFDAELNGNENNDGKLLALVNDTSERDIWDDVEDFPNNSTSNPVQSETKDCCVPGLWSQYSHYEKPIKGKKFTSNLVKNEEILRSGNLTFKVIEKSSSTRVRREKPSDSLSGLFKPFEMTKKIDKKFESRLERILENNGLISGNDERHSPNIRGCRELPEGLHGGVGGEIYSYKRNRQLPKLNNFTNNWINRAEQHLSNPYAIKESISRNFIVGNESDSTDNKNLRKHFKDAPCRSACNSFRCDEKVVMELRKEICECTKSAKWEYEEDINLRRPQLHNRYKLNYTAKTQKSSSCGDLPQKSSKFTNRSFRNGLDKGKSESSIKTGSKKKAVKNTGNQKVKLPPIEASIICTEIVGGPKILTRTFPKKYL